MKRLGVFCGSHSGNQPDFAIAAKHVGQLLLKNKIELVYGGGRLGLMGTLANTILKGGGNVIGVVPKFLLDKEGHPNLTKLHIVETMHERKALIFSLADAFLLMPGGSGSLDEFFEIYTWSQLHLHDKPCAILNYNRYYDDLIRFLDHAVAAGFLEKTIAK
ncbi:LOG family protein [Legionella tunisiensis]|uniref:LOG family protein n=1 Tax=Legionella tunisiensis TaxID=1034944 RepID=UPI0002FCCECA|nr:TIGR00730 family Rossman fold protein [Legionella tunisiensis]